MPHPSRKDRTGKRFGKLVVVEMTWPQGVGHVRCDCDCGGTWYGRADRLVSVENPSCGCEGQRGLILGRQYQPLDLVGQPFNSLTVEQMHRGYGRWYVTARCVCGKEWFGPAKALRNNRTKSCGCRQHEGVARRKDLTEQRSGRLVVIATWWKDGERYVKAECDCGGMYEGVGGPVAAGVVRSCGCLKQEYIASLMVTDDVKKIRAREQRQRREQRERKTRNFPRSYRQFMLDYWKGCCAVCGVSAGLWHWIAADHWVSVSSPTSPGEVITNMIPLCHKKRGAPRGTPSCNNRKYNHDPHQWLVATLGPMKAKTKLKEIEEYFAAAQAYAASGKEVV